MKVTQVEKQIYENGEILQEIKIMSKEEDIAIGMVVLGKHDSDLTLKVF